MFFVQMEVGLMKVKQCVNRSWTHDGYFGLWNNWSTGRNVHGECPDNRCDTLVYTSVCGPFLLRVPPSFWGSTVSIAE